MPVKIVPAGELAAGLGLADQEAPPVPNVPMAAGVTNGTTGTGAGAGRRPERLT